MIEKFKKIPGHDDYMVSNLGRVKSVKFNKDRILKFNTTNSGYKYVVFSKKDYRKNFCVHQLVAMAFLGHSPDGWNVTIDHINGIKTDNRLSNLQLLTWSEHMIKDKPNPFGYPYVQKRGKKYRARKTVNGKSVYSSTYVKPEDAYNCLMKKEM